MRTAAVMLFFPQKNLPQVYHPWRRLQGAQAIFFATDLACFISACPMGKTHDHRAVTQSGHGDSPVHAGPCNTRPWRSKREP